MCTIVSSLYDKTKDWQKEVEQTRRDQEDGVCSHHLTNAMIQQGLVRGISILSAMPLTENKDRELTKQIVTMLAEQAVHLPQPETPEEKVANYTAQVATGIEEAELSIGIDDPESIGQRLEALRLQGYRVAPHSKEDIEALIEAKKNLRETTSTVQKLQGKKHKGLSKIPSLDQCLAAQRAKEQADSCCTTPPEETKIAYPPLPGLYIEACRRQEKSVSPNNKNIGTEHLPQTANIQSDAKVAADPVEQIAEQTDNRYTTPPEETKIAYPPLPGLYIEACRRQEKSVSPNNKNIGTEHLPQTANIQSDAKVAADPVEQIAEQTDNHRTTLSEKTQITYPVLSDRQKKSVSSSNKEISTYTSDNSYRITGPLQSEIVTVRKEEPSDYMNHQTTPTTLLSSSSPSLSPSCAPLTEPEKLINRPTSFLAQTVAFISATYQRVRSSVACQRMLSVVWSVLEKFRS